MVSATFMHLNADKQARILAALNQEFSAHPVAEAQVARIVASAGIARGAFYKYFTDLTDAYRYLFGSALRTIHVGLHVATAGGFDAANYLANTRQFLVGVQVSPYRALMVMHFKTNEAVLPARPTPPTPDAAAWAAEVLCHQTIKDVLLAPATAEARLEQLAATLQILENRGPVNVSRD